MGERFNEPISGTTTITEDKHSAIAYSQNDLVNEKTKHIGLKWHFLKDHVEPGTIRLRYMTNDQMLAYTFTKPLPEPALTTHRSAILGGVYAMQLFMP
jgi:hypothetical protein